MNHASMMKLVENLKKGKAAHAPVKIFLTTILSATLLFSGALIESSPAQASASCSTGDFCVYEHPNYGGKWFGTRQARFAWNCVFHDSFCGTTRKLNDKDSSWKNLWQNRSSRVFEHPEYKGKSFCLNSKKQAKNKDAVAHGFQDRGSSHKNTSGNKYCEKDY